MGFCADKHCVKCALHSLFLIMLLVNRLDGGVDGASRHLKSFDIWDLEVRKPQAPEQTRDGTITMASDALLHDYSQKTGLRSGKVLSFFPVLSEDECKSEDGRRLGVCMNAYDCHRKSGSSKGQCALGFGVCCVFTASCGQEIRNNITYIVSPNFPALMPLDVKSCAVKIKMMSPDVSQLRFDFVHFSMGQPNRRTGSCDGDIFSLLGGPNGEFKLCGQNNGQHIYYDVLNGKSREGEAVRDIDVVMNFTSALPSSRFWEIRVSQIPFSQRAPTGCLQYFTGNDGVIQTFNFAENGRHLANQHYRACVRQERGMCSIAYEPCNEHSFRIGHSQMPYTPNQNGPYQNDVYQNQVFNPNGAQNGAFPANNINGPYQPSSPNGVYATNNGVPNTNPAIAGSGMPSPNAAIGPNGMPAPFAPQMGPPGTLNALNPSSAPAQMGGGSVPPGGGAGGPGAGAANDMPAVATSQTNQTVQNDDLGQSINATTASVTSTTMPTTNATATNSITTTTTTTPASQNDEEVEGSGDGEEDEGAEFSSLFSLGSFLTRAALFRSARSADETREPGDRSPRQFFSFCTDRITMPCIVEDFISAGMGSVPSCSPVHCGGSLCPAGASPCRVESTVTPFGLGIHFGDGTFKGSPEDNIGACLRFSQLSCA